MPESSDELTPCLTAIGTCPNSRNCEYTSLVNAPECTLFDDRTVRRGFAWGGIFVSQVHLSCTKFGRHHIESTFVRGQPNRYEHLSERSTWSVLAFGWKDFIKRIKLTTLRRMNRDVVNVANTVSLFSRVGDSHSSAWFVVLEKLFAEVLLKTSFINWCIRCIFPIEGKVVPGAQSQVRLFRVRQRYVRFTQMLVC